MCRVKWRALWRHWSASWTRAAAWAFGIEARKGSYLLLHVEAIKEKECACMWSKEKGKKRNEFLFPVYFRQSIASPKKRTYTAQMGIQSSWKLFQWVSIITYPNLNPIGYILKPQAFLHQTWFRRIVFPATQRNMAANFHDVHAANKEGVTCDASAKYMCTKEMKERNPHGLAEGSHKLKTKWMWIWATKKDGQHAAEFLAYHIIEWWKRARPPCMWRNQLKKRMQQQSHMICHSKTGMAATKRKRNRENAMI